MHYVLYLITLFGICLRLSSRPIAERDGPPRPRPASTLCHTPTGAFARSHTTCGLALFQMALNSSTYSHVQTDLLSAMDRPDPISKMSRLGRKRYPSAHETSLKSESKRKRRALKRSFLRSATTEDKHIYDISLWSQCTLSVNEGGVKSGKEFSVRPSLRGNRRVFTNVRVSYDGVTLLSVGYGLVVTFEDATVGFGLKTTEFIPRKAPITQYEGEILSRDQSNRRLISHPGSCSHFATPVKGGPTINGFQRSPTLPNADNNSPSHDILSFGVSEQLRLGSPGDPIYLSFADMKGKGGGSFANHRSPKDEDGPNAVFEPDRFIGTLGSRDETALFLIAKRDIRPGDFIRVDYGSMFIRSSKTNIFCQT